MSENTKMKNIEVLFYPKSVAIIGASDVPYKPSAQPLKGMIDNGFKGIIYPVNPRYQSINGTPCYPSLDDVPGPVDLAIIGVPAVATLAAIKECAKKKVKGVVVLTSGFSEIGEEGAMIQAEMLRIARDNGMVICGPNSQGLFNSLNGLTAGFAIPKLFDPQKVKNSFGFISQSGGVGTAIYLTSLETKTGFTYSISSGNEADVEFSDYLNFMVNDPDTKAIGGYLEGVRDGRKLLYAADQALQAEKPLVILKAGKSPTAAKAAASHTGSIVGSDGVYSAFFQQKGIIRTESIEEMSLILNLLIKRKLPTSNRVAIVANSGGNGVLLSDKCDAAGLDIVELSSSTRERLEKILPTFGSSANPVDITSQILMQPELHAEAIRIVLEDPNVDMMIVDHWPLSGNDTSGLDQIIRVHNDSDKPFLISMLGAESYGRGDMAYLLDNHVPAVRSQELAARALGAVGYYGSRLQKIKKYRKSTMEIPAEDRKKVADILNSVPLGESLSESQAKQLLLTYGIPCTMEKPANDVEAAVSFAEEIGFPVVLKIDSTEIQHKTEAGGVKLNLKSNEEVRRAFHEIMASASQYAPQAHLDGVLVQEMLTDGSECIVGVTQDQTFGPTIMFGLGGVFVEVLQDVALKICPLTYLDAQEMITEIKGKKILGGFRGSAPADKEAIIDVILRVSQLAMDFPEIKEMDLNPLMVFERGEGVKVADALIVTGKDSNKE